MISCVFQFGILPPLMSVVEPSALWRLMPLFMLGLISYQSFFEVDPSLLLISGSFMAMKTLEFSVRRMLDELVYVPLDFESRYLVSFINKHHYFLCAHLLLFPNKR